VVISHPFAPFGLCNNAVLKVPYITYESFLPGNIFSVQLSNASGSFSTPVTIGTLAATSSDTIVCTIPAATPAGTGYRIRIAASNPAYTSEDNGSNISIGNGALPAVPVITSNSPICNATQLVLSATSATTGATYRWTRPLGGIATTQTLTINSAYVQTDAGLYTVVAVSGACASQPAYTTVVIDTTVHPTITISASPGTSIAQGTSVTFSISNMTNGGTNPAYQWYLNNNAVSGATNATYTSNTLANNDAIKVKLNSNAHCALQNIYSNQLVMNVSSGVASLPEKSQLKLYPSPGNGKFVLTAPGITINQPVIIEIFTMSGQRLYTTHVSAGANGLQTEIDLSGKLTAGIYMVSVTSAHNRAWCPLTVDK